MSSELTRRGVLAGIGVSAAMAALPRGVTRLPEALAAKLRRPDSRPDPHRPPGTPDPRIPIEHVVVVMMENHSFDNYLGMLPRRGRPGADGFSFDRHGRPTAVNRTSSGRPVRAFQMPTYCQEESQPRQDWNGTRIEIDGGRMDGFVRASGDVAMGYWDADDLPFYYSLASTFPLANRWFASAPCQTYPNRRYLQAATSWGLINDPVPGPNDAPPPNGTIFDRLHAYGLSWLNYFTDLPSTGLVTSTVKKYPTSFAPVEQFFTDCATGRLPNFAVVDPEFGMTDVVGGEVPGGAFPQIVRAQGGDEENPQNVRYGEAFVAQVVNAVMQSPAWPRTLLLWVYDEHGGYYDHVPPPRAIPPDSIPPDLHAGDIRGGFDIYGLRVPAVVVSPWGRRGHESRVVHDHTSVLAFLALKWNLPALTWRDANAAPMLDFLSFRRPGFVEPPVLAAAAPPLGGRGCSTADPGR